MNKEFNFETMITIHNACNNFKEALKNESLPIKKIAWSMLCDILFEEEAVEVAKDCAKKIEKATHYLGAYKAENEE